MIFTQLFNPRVNSSNQIRELVRLVYCFSIKMDESALDRLFSGDVERLIQQPKRVVRLFISSTFTDMTFERNNLMERVYPRLKKYCRERHGLDFQVVDMRWGVRDEATDDHQTVNLCSREIDNCQRMSLGPNFVALLGDKYGFRPLCNKIKSTEYRALRRCLIELDINTDFLDTWYKEDLNAVPAEYLLQPISSILRNFTNKAEPELQSVDQRIWQAIQERLHELLMIGSSRLVKQGRMSEQEQLMKYSISVTEREVIEGCLNVTDAKSHCLVYVRSISDLKAQLDKCLAASTNSAAAATAAGSSPQQLNPAATVSSGDGGGELGDSVSGSSTGGGSRRAGTVTSERKDSKVRRASLKIGDDTISLTTRSGAYLSAAERRVERARRLIARYIDLSSRDGVWRIDEEAQRALANLKENKLERKFNNGGGGGNNNKADGHRSLTRFKLLWNEQEGVSLKSEEHKHYLNELSEHLYTNLTRMIRKAAKSEQQFKSGLVGEVLQHLHYAKHVSKTFHGRSDELDKVRSYVLSHSIEADSMPMFIYGVGGSGKTSILARAVTLAKDWVLRANNYSKRDAHETAAEVERWDQKPCIVARFCCTTPNSSSMLGVLTSVCRQLQFNFYQYGPMNGLQAAVQQNLGQPDDGRQAGDLSSDAQLVYQPIPEDFVRLVFTFRQLLDNCQHHYHRQRLFLIILDSVERLSSPAESSVEVKHSWLTSITRLPANVKLIVSCSSEKTAELWGEDYLHLKRHFIQLYFNHTNQPEDAISRSRSSRRLQHDDDDNDDQPFGSSVESLSLPSLDSYNHRFATSVQTDHNGSRNNAASGDSDFNGVVKRRIERRCKEKYCRMKRILVPAVRLKRGPEESAKRKGSASRWSSGDHSYGYSQRARNLNVDSTTTTHMTNNWSLRTITTPGHQRLASSLSGALIREPGNGPAAHFNTSIGMGADGSNRSSMASIQTSVSGTGNSPLLYNDSDMAGQLTPRHGYGRRRRDHHHHSAPWILHIRPMGRGLALDVVQRWLQGAGRNITQQQWSLVERSFVSCSRPIFVKLAFGEIVNWKSYSLHSDTTKGLTFGSSLLGGDDGLLLDSSVPQTESAVAALEGDVNTITRVSDFGLALKTLFENTGGSVSGAGGGRIQRDATAGELEWQILSMEQQWLNYLDYTQRKSQKVLDDLKAAAANESNLSDEDKRRSEVAEGSIVIRIDGATTTTTTTAVGTAGEGRSHGSTTTTSSGAGGGASICHLSSTIDDAICQLFARIELQHGYVLTKHSLSYINAARNGICENELEDVLSLDDVVLDDVFQYHLPPVRRIPPLLWTRIRNDLPDYLSERDADGIVINWHHSQFKQVTQQRYLSDAQQVLYIHSNLADYFLGKWADKPKPFRCTRQQIQMAAEQLESAVQQSARDSQAAGSGGTGGRKTSLNRLGGGPNGKSSRSGASFSVRSRLRSSDQYDQRLQWMQAKADRRVPHQPLYYTHEPSGGSSNSNNATATSTLPESSANPSHSKDSSALSKASTRAPRRRYNLRKLTELPYHLIKAGRFLDLANHCLFNYKWLYTALDAMGLQSLLSDFSEAARALEQALNERLTTQLVETSTLSAPERSNPNDNNKTLDLAINSATRGLGARGADQHAEPPDESIDVLRSILSQLAVLDSTVRLSCSAIHADTQMLAPQLIGRLSPLVRPSSPPPGRVPMPALDSRERTTIVDDNDNTCGSGAQPPQRLLFDGAGSGNRYLIQLLDQCDRDGSADCSLLPIDHCLQSADGIQLSSLEGHSFAIMSMSMAADRRHLLAVSNRFIMWDIATGEVSRDVDPKIEGSIMKQLKMGLNNEYAVAYTSNNVLLVLDILTQQVSKFDKFCDSSSSPASNPNSDAGSKAAPPSISGRQRGNAQSEEIIGLDLIDRMGATRFVVWSRAGWSVLRIVNNEKLHHSSRGGGFFSANTMLQRISIELEYSFNLANIDDDLTSFAAMQILSVQQVKLNGTTTTATSSSATIGGAAGEQAQEEEELTCVVVELSRGDSQTANSDESLQLITIKSFSGPDGELQFRLWDQRISATSMVLEPHLKRLVFANSMGDLYLSRRRSSCWSQPKLIYSGWSRTKSFAADGEANDDSAGVGSKPADWLSTSLVTTNPIGWTPLTSQLPLAIELETSRCPKERTDIDHSDDDDDDDVEEHSDGGLKEAKLAEFERQLDALQAHDEIEENCVFKSFASAEESRARRHLDDDDNNNDEHHDGGAEHQSNHKHKRSSRKFAAHSPAIRIVKLYFSNRILLLRLDSGAAAGVAAERLKSLHLPSDIQNISVEPNRCQMKSLLVEAATRRQRQSSAGLASNTIWPEYLVAATGRRLLLFSVRDEQFLKSIDDAHSARIVQLVPINQPSAAIGAGAGKRRSEGAAAECWSGAKHQSRQLIASASMDKTVKIWNLSNLHKQFYALDRLDNPLESICFRPQQQQQQRPLVACLSRGELGLWDWQRLKLVARISQNDPLLDGVVAPTEAGDASKSANQVSGAHQQHCINNGGGGGSSHSGCGAGDNSGSNTKNNNNNSKKIVKCRFSSNGRYLCLATSDAIHLFAISDAPPKSHQQPHHSHATSSNRDGSPAGAADAASAPPSGPPAASAAAFNLAGARPSCLSSGADQSTPPTSLETSFKYLLPAAGSVKKLNFFLDDSRLLITLETTANASPATTTAEQQQQQPTDGPSLESEDLAEGTSRASVVVDDDDGDDDDDDEKLLPAPSWRRAARQLLLLCLTVPDARLIYTIEYLTPTTLLQTTTAASVTTAAAANKSHYLVGGSPARPAKAAAANGRLRVAAKDDRQAPDDRLQWASRGRRRHLQRRRSSAATDAATTNAADQARIRLPVITRDQLHVVTVECDWTTAAANRGTSGQDRDELPSPIDRRPLREASSVEARLSLSSSSAAPPPPPVLLNVYSTRDGLLVRSINLNQLEMYEPAPRKSSQPAAASTSRDGGDNSAARQAPSVVGSDVKRQPRDLGAVAELAPNAKRALPFKQVSIGAEQFTRLKAARHYERQSIVALIDDDKGASFSIDVNTKQLVSLSNIWNGKLTSDGRYGLSRMFKSATLGGGTGSGAGLLSAGRLQLLEMRHSSPIKCLLTSESLAKLTAGGGSVGTASGAPNASGTASAATASDADIICGFTRPNDAYVYYYDSRLKRLLLIRLHDGQLIANYKLSVAVTKIKCSNDGYALVLGHADGLLTSLAIVDSMTSDTLVRLSQYPSRMGPSGGGGGTNLNSRLK